MRVLLSLNFWLGALKTGASAAYGVIKWMIPALIVVRILDALGGTASLAWLFAPLVEVIGLPAWTSIVWATAIFANLYAGLAVLALHEGFAELTVAQMSILSTVMLVAHSLPVEARIMQLFGVRLWQGMLLRLSGALLLGAVLNIFYTTTGLLSGPVVLLWEIPVSEAVAGDYLGLFWREARALAVLAVIVVVLVMFMEVLKEFGFVRFCEKLMLPLLRLMGIGPALAHIVVIGMLLGLTYSSGLLLAERRKQNFAQKDLAVALIFVSMCHAIVEDSLVLLLSGAHISAVLFARLFFCLGFACLLMRWSASQKLGFYRA